MIKFFRKIRQQMLSENKFSKYLLYAIGEIVLVVIGILIAVSINNWNSNRKQQQEIQQLFRAFEQDLITNIEAGNETLEWGVWKDSIIRLVLGKEVTEETYQNIEFGALTMNYTTTVTIRDNLDKILEKEDQISSELQPLLHSLKLYKGRIEECQQYEEVVTHQVAEHIKFFSDNMEWFAAYLETGDKRGVEYFLTDPFYLNRVAIYRAVMIEDYISNVGIARNRALGLLYDLQRVIDKGETGTNSENIFKKLGYKPMKRIGCEEQLELTDESPFTYPPLILNETSDTVQVRFYLLESGKPLDMTINILPKKQWDGSVYRQGYYEVIKNDVCVAKYTGNQDYILLN